jgi:hypothetical protein
MHTGLLIHGVLWIIVSQMMCIADEQLNDFIIDIASSTTCPCNATICAVHHGGYRIGVALVDSMQQDPSVVIGGDSGRLVLLLQKYFLQPVFCHNMLCEIWRIPLQLNVIPVVPVRML